MESMRNFDSFRITFNVFDKWDLSDNGLIDDCCAISLTFHGILIFCRISIIFLLPSPYPILNPANPNDFVKDLRMKRLSNSFRYETTLSLPLGTNSMKHSSRNTIADFSYADSRIFNMFFFFMRTPVGLFGLHRKTQYFFEISSCNSAKFWFRLIVLKK